MSNDSALWRTHHELTKIRFVLDIPTRAEPGVFLGYAIGESATKRGHLWHEASQWIEGLDDTYHAPADWLHHIALTALQDRPNSQERLLFGLTGGLGVQDPLF